MSEEEKKAIEELKSLSPSEQSIEILLNLIEKQNKIIDKMAEEIYNLDQKQDMRNDNITIWINKEHILNYFTKKE